MFPTSLLLFASLLAIASSKPVATTGLSIASAEPSDVPSAAFPAVPTVVSGAPAIPTVSEPASLPFSEGGAQPSLIPSVSGQAFPSGCAPPFMHFAPGMGHPTFGGAESQHKHAGFAQGSASGARPSFALSGSGDGGPATFSFDSAMPSSFPAMSGQACPTFTFSAGGAAPTFPASGQAAPTFSIDASDPPAVTASVLPPDVSSDAGSPVVTATDADGSAVPAPTATSTDGEDGSDAPSDTSDTADEPTATSTDA